MYPGKTLQSRNCISVNVLFEHILQKHENLKNIEFKWEGVAFCTQSLTWNTKYIVACPSHVHRWIRLFCTGSIILYKFVVFFFKVTTIPQESDWSFAFYSSRNKQTLHSVKICLFRRARITLAFVPAWFGLRFLRHVTHWESFHSPQLAGIRTFRI